MLKKLVIFNTLGVTPLDFIKGYRPVINLEGIDYEILNIFDNVFFISTISENDLNDKEFQLVGGDTLNGNSIKKMKLV